MTKNYLLIKRQVLGLDIKKINYDFEIEDTNEPTKWIKIIIHHTGNKKTIQEIIDLHVKKNNWSQIGYHFLIGKKGTIYQSRELRYAGAHTFGYNKNSIGIALFGNFDEDEPTEKQIESLKQLIEAIKKEHEIRKIYGHNQAIYKLIRKKYYQQNLPDINILDLSTRLKYDAFRKEISTKVLEHDASESAISLLKKFKSCPGYNMYKVLKKLQKL